MILVSRAASGLSGSPSVLLRSVSPRLEITICASFSKTPEEVTVIGTLHIFCFVLLIISRFVSDTYLVRPEAGIHGIGQGGERA